MQEARCTRKPKNPIPSIEAPVQLVPAGGTWGKMNQPSEKHVANRMPKENL